MDHINRTSESAKLHKSFPRGGNTTLENVQVLELHWRKKKLIPEALTIVVGHVNINVTQHCWDPG